MLKQRLIGGAALLVVGVLALILLWLWVDATADLAESNTRVVRSSRKVVQLEDENKELQFSLEAVRADLATTEASRLEAEAALADKEKANDQLRDNLDDALANLYKAREKAKDAGNDGEYQFYRGVYAGCVAIGRMSKVPPAQSLAFCVPFTQTAQEQGAYDLDWGPTPGIGGPSQSLPSPQS